MAATAMTRSVSSAIVGPIVAANTNHNTDTASALTALVERARDGDRQAFADLYRQRLAPVSRYVGAIVRDPHRTEDAVGQTFLHAWRDLAKLRRADRFDAWLFRIAHNRALDELPKHDTESLPEDLTIPDTAIDGSPERSLDRNQRTNAVRAALLDLPETQRDVVTLHSLLGLPHRQVAQQLGKSEVAVRAIYSRATTALRDRLQASRAVGDL